MVRKYNSVSYNVALVAYYQLLVSLHFLLEENNINIFQNLKKKKTFTSNNFILHIKFRIVMTFCAILILTVERFNIFMWNPIPYYSMFCVDRDYLSLILLSIIIFI